MASGCALSWSAARHRCWWPTTCARAKGNTGGFADASAASIRTGRGLTTVPIFILVPQVTIKKRFDIDSVAQKWIDRTPQLIIQNWQENEQK